MKILLTNLIISFVLSVIIGIIILPILRKFKIGQIVRDDGPKEHLKKNGTPIMGGLIIIIPVVMILIFNITKDLIYLLPLCSILGFALIGFIDDFKKLILKNTDGLSPKGKIIGQFIISAIFILLYINYFKIGTDIIIPFLNEPYVLGLGIFVIFTVFVLIGTTNACNLTDGLDGLLGGVSVIIMTFFTIVALKRQDTQMVILGSAVIGSTLGFLIFNVHPAKIFLGDTGSFALGAAISTIAIYEKMPLYLIIVCFIPIIDTISVIIQVVYFKITKGKRIFKMAPFHHHLELSGMKENKVVLLFWFLTLIVCTVGYFII